MTIQAAPIAGMSPKRAGRLADVGSWRIGERKPQSSKVGNGPRIAASLREAIEACSLRHGSVVSFHHHFRDGDRTMAAVFAELADAGLRDLTLAASSLFPTHATLIPFVTAGVIGRIITDYVRGPLADAIVEGRLGGLSVLQTHGGRARAIESGELRIDAAFVAAPLAHVSGATTGRGGRLACGPLGYPMVDAAYARTTVVLADTITADELPHTDIPAHHVDVMVAFADPGDPAGIRSGSTLPQETQEARLISAMVVRIIEAAGLIRQGFSFQTGAGGFSLSGVSLIGRKLAETGVVADYVSGGIAAGHVNLLKQGLIRRIRDVQSFDLTAVQSSMTHPEHRIMSAAEYASPDHPDAAVDGLSVMLLGAAEIDLDFNVNVALGGNGQIIGGPGGHPDAAQGAGLSIVTTTLTGGGFARVVEEVGCVTTPGIDVDVLVTDDGVALNPSRADLAGPLRRAGIGIEPIEALQARASKRSRLARIEPEGRPVVAVEHRAGGAIDAIRSR